jgi:hypothetical protein
VKPSVAAISTSPAFAASSAPNSAMLSAGPQWQVTATPTMIDFIGTWGLMR